MAVPLSYHAHLSSVVQEEHIRNATGMPLVLGGLGLRSAIRLNKSAFWASWADCVRMVLSRHRDGHPTASAMWLSRGPGARECVTWLAARNNIACGQALQGTCVV